MSEDALFEKQLKSPTQIVGEWREWKRQRQAEYDQRDLGRQHFMEERRLQAEVERRGVSVEELLDSYEDY